MLTYSFAERGELSLYEYLYQCIRADIESCAIAPDEKLPSKRSLANHLGVSLITVEGAYSQLIAEGYVRSEPRRGYYACRLDAAGRASAVKPVGQSWSGETVPEEGLAEAYAALSRPVGPATASRQMIDLAGGTAPEGLFPYGVWAKTVREALACESERALVGESSFAGTVQLRQAIAKHLREFRGMEADPDCIVVGAGSQVLYNWLVQLLGRSKHYAVEDPGYTRLSRIYEANDVALSHLALDEQGVSLDAVNGSGADVLHLMPSHQYPTGIVTSISRRYELLGWASQVPGRYIIEDDYDCEFRLTGKPIPTLASIDATGCVIYTNTFTKSLGPAFRIAYMVLPPALAARFADELGFYSSTVSAIDQLALARFIENGDYERHTNRMRTHYRTVRNELIEALRASALAGRMRITAQDSGIHFVLHIETDQGQEWDDAFVSRAAQAGVRILPLSAFCAQQSTAQRFAHAFLVAYSGLEKETIPQLVGALERAAR